MEYYAKTLDNGIRIIHKPVKSLVGHCAIMINAGSRDEKENEHGIAHFIEHVIFKGTQKRKAYHILSRLDDVGGELNAYTTKEETCIYASFLIEDFERAVELLHDITFNSVFPEKEIEKEKEVIIDEINSYKDTPSELIFDEFEELVFGDNPMGRNILGTPELLKSFTKNDIINFIQNNYHTDQIVFCSVGNIPIKKIDKIANRYFDKIPENRRKTTRSEISDYKPSIKTLDKNTYQSHVMVGNIAYPFQHKDRLGLSLLNNLLGGPGMNSRLNLSLREKNGIAYNIESVYTPYDKTGIFSIYFGTDEENIERSLNIIHKELKKLRTKPLGILQLSKAIRQLKGQLAISSDNHENLMLALGKSYMLFNKVDSLEAAYKKIDKITSGDLQRIANEIFDENSLSLLIYK
jgi:predicted Zn-dependent peptidase